MRMQFYPRGHTGYTLHKCTAKTQYQKFWTNIPRKGIARPRSQFPHLCACERFKIPTIGLPIRMKEIFGPTLGKYINRSQTHECGILDWGRTIPFLGIHKWDFRCSVAVPYVILHDKMAQLAKNIMPQAKFKIPRKRDKRMPLCCSFHAHKLQTKLYVHEFGFGRKLTGTVKKHCYDVHIRSYIVTESIHVGFSLYKICRNEGWQPWSTIKS